MVMVGNEYTGPNQAMVAYGKFSDCPDMTVPAKSNIITDHNCWGIRFSLVPLPRFEP